ncbi:isoleucine--tRNA ligase [Oenococcus kitaharae]|uniref:Isoleucine--tRNA ligase n=1 Tax=Oenococcus kitaharae DSM 17330 TaxID=1045004 RepID=G9WH03_9LACO|nr:isoleucine--tRNA ligase [Oenococcus kitaharae]EHN59411.1 Isoleucyl-tRNA synthetase [Oenococcus kitaharae DSM 17330]OEY83287.1 isoleucine--tRNA ligase [Oenococcus kitaharae]OEY85085.1 isoleucine--tRNA ligase [Oenococcus kitaharae]OEY85940.1 isoleucine--tRNA ligase [Oenococcus kitaharae]
MKIKDTLHLGHTDFPMRGSLPKTEPVREKQWADDKVYEQRLELNKNKPHFNLHDGPPYANGNIHIGHAMNKISKDIIVRYKNMTGYYAPYVPGWDTHGLPIEQQLTKAGHDRKAMAKADWRRLAHDYALKQVDMQRRDFKRLGVLGDWDHPYLTLHPEFEAAQIRVFGAMAGKGYIYRGLKPVYWSWSSESALAEAEIEYHDLESTSLFYANRVKDGKGILDRNTYLVVWTTTPFTVTASRGITLGPDFDYVLVKAANDDRKFVVAKALLEENAKRFGWQDYKVLATYKGMDLDKITVEHPWDPDVTELVMNADHVTLDAGTGLVHTAPGFGEDDYNVGMKYGIEVAMTVDEKGYLMASAGPDFQGKFYDDVAPIVIDKLKAAGLWLATEKIVHSYPFDWRTKKPIIWRAVPQWFVSIEPFRKQILDQIENVTFYPDWGKVRLYNMIKDRGDWVISRQRVWGVPLPIFYAEDKTPIVDEKLIDHVADLFAKYGSTYWFEHTAKELLPDGYTNPHSPHGEFTKEEDIMDVWFDSGSSWAGVMQQRDNLDYPADVYLEGADQFRGWFNSNIITSVAVNGIAPYKSVIAQGFVFDDKGQKMSKSLGNIISPNEIADQMGIEIIRLWVMSIDSSEDVHVSRGILKQVSESYRKIRNTMRFLLANTEDFDAKKDRVPFEKRAAVDKWMTVKLNQFVKDWHEKMQRYDFYDLFKQLINFVSTDLSAFYLDVAKDIVYIDEADSAERRSMQTVFYETAVTLTKLLTPFLPHTAEEIWENLQEPETYAYLSEAPEFQPIAEADSLLTDWQTFFDFRDQVNKELENAREKSLIGKSAEAALTVVLTKEQADTFAKLGLDLRKLLMVSQLTQSQGSETSVQVAHASGAVDPRDRLFHDDIGADQKFPMFSKKNAEIVEHDFPTLTAADLED